MCLISCRGPGCQRVRRMGESAMDRLSAVMHDHAHVFPTIEDAFQRRVPPMPNHRPSQDELLEWMTSLSNWGRWGKEDQLGTLNFLSPTTTRRAAGLIKDGGTVSCARPVAYDAGPHAPRPPQHFMVMSGDPYRSGDGGPDRQVAMDYFGLIFHGHSVTHLDSLAHFFWDGSMYNGWPSHLVSTAEGATAESIDLAHRGIVTRGILVDAPLVRGVEWLELGDGVSLADIGEAKDRCGIVPQEGDVLLLRTGQYQRWLERGPIDSNTEGSSGPLPEILPLVRESGVAVLGSDTGNDVRPTGYPRFTNPVHQIGLVAMGLWILDNANLEELAHACVERGRWEFFVQILPLRIPNATGSPVNPVAVF